MTQESRAPMPYHHKKDHHGIVRVDPLPSIQGLQDYYATKYYQDSDGKKTTYDTTYTPQEIAYKQLEARLTLQGMIENISPQIDRPRILDLGCGEGFLVKEFSLQGYDVTGVDFSSFGVSKWNPEVMDRCRFGDIYEDLNQVKSRGETFDVCILRNVLEHVLNPESLMSQIRDVLSPDGIAMVTVPNDYCDLQKLAMDKGYIDREFWFAPPDHLTYFNTKNIKLFMQDCQFVVKDMFSSFPIDFFLFHPGSNYIADRTRGKSAHFARIDIDLLLAREGMDKFLALYRAMANCGVGRDMTVVVAKV
jgi:2-polyprenyl-3-methyl-5-hydroxy-6-metoxy-1,4-benzoquinol methylase